MFQTQSLPAGPIAVAVAPNGGTRTRADHPAIPLTPAEVAREAVACLEAGAAMLHVHVRDAAGAHLLDATAYGEMMAAVRAAVGDALVIQITTEALGRYPAGAQRDVVRAVRPEAASIALRELLPAGGDERIFEAFVREADRAGTALQFILYEPAEAVRLDALRRRGVVPLDALSVLYVLGRYSPGQRSAPGDLDPFLAAGQPRFERWMMCAFGPAEADCAITAARFGGDVRIGFENNLWMPDGQLAPGNAALVRAVSGRLDAAGIRRLDAAGLRAAWRSGPGR